MSQEKIRKSMRFFQIIGFSGLLLIGGSIAVWSALASIQGAIIASGITIVDGYSKKVQHREGGIVTKIAVTDGDYVKAGDVLINLDETEIKSQLAILEALIIDNEIRISGLKALRDDASDIIFPKDVLDRQAEPKIAKIITGQKNLFKTIRDARAGRTGQLNQQIGQKEKEITGRKAQLKSREAQYDLISKELKGLKKLLAKGLVPITRVLALQRERANLSGQEGQLDAEIAVSRGRIGEIKLQITQLADDDHSKTLSELREIESKLAEWRERRIAVRATLKRTKILAPRAGYIHQSGVHTIGGVIAPGEVTMLIIPSLDNLVVEANINPQDIDQIITGQSVRLRFSAFSQRTTPEIKGTVSYVSADHKQPDNNAPPYYSIKIKMKETELKRLGSNKIIPGMPVEAFVQTDARTPLNYLIKPLKDQIMRAFRED